MFVVLQEFYVSWDAYAHNYDHPISINFVLFPIPPLSKSADFLQARACQTSQQASTQQSAASTIMIGEQATKEKETATITTEE